VSGSETTPGPDDTVLSPIVFYDGDCGLCQRSVSFLIARDPAATLRFARLQGEIASRLLSAEQRDVGPGGSLVLFEPADGRVSLRSAAVLRALSHLPGIWRFAGAVASLGPAVRALDVAYRLLARSRRWWFAAPESCPLPGSAARRRLLD
jgi:predicted DCC family thiol-disulfide oxidoreductase YuxK